jgi:glycosyltransferase involved in cell wall biosynthesis
MNNNQFASVVIPTKNRLLQTKNAIKSALNISFINEIILVDDGSNFDLDLYIEDIAFSSNVKIKILANKFTSGAQGARLTGVLETSNDIIIFLDSDDILVQSGIEKLFKLIKSDNDISLTYGQILFGNSKSNWLQLNGFCYKKVLKNLSLCPFSGLFIRKSKINWNELDLTLPAWQDDDLCLLASKSGKLAFIDHIVAKNTLSDDSISKSRSKQLKGLTLLINKYKIDIVSNFGYQAILLWRCRQFALFLETYADEINTVKKNKNIILNISFKIISNILKLISKIIKLLLSRYFERIYC